MGFNHTQQLCNPDYANQSASKPTTPRHFSCGGVKLHKPAITARHSGCPLLARLVQSNKLNLTLCAPKASRKSEPSIPIRAPPSAKKCQSPVLLEAKHDRRDTVEARISAIAIRRLKTLILDRYTHHYAQIFGVPSAGFRGSSSSAELGRDIVQLQWRSMKRTRDARTQSLTLKILSTDFRERKPPRS